MIEILSITPEKKMKSVLTIFLILFAVGLTSCLNDENVTYKYIGKVKGKKLYEYTIDGCQYIRTNFKDIIHKGNCNNHQ